MNKVLLAAVALLATSLSIRAAEDSLKLGFCNGEIAERTDIELKGSGTVEAAVKFSVGSLSAYRHTSVSAVNVALVNRINIDELTVWVRSSLEGPNLAQGTITRTTDPKIAKGWNVVGFEEPYEITGETPLFIGYSFHQKANVQAVSMVGEPIADTSFLKMGDTDWCDISEKGVLSLEAVLTGDALPEFDLGIVSAGISPYPSSGANALMVKAAVTNYGTRDVGSFTIRCHAGDLSCTSNLYIPIASTKTANVQFVIDPGVPTDTDTEWTVEIAGIDGGEDSNAENNSVTAICSFLKNVLVEEFTTEKCVNCPTMAARLHTVLGSNPDYAERVNAVCHHAGFYTDGFTLQCDTDLLWFYNAGGNTYAPALMFDRSADYSGKTDTPVCLPQTEQLISDAIDQAMGRTANSMIGLALDIDKEACEVKVKATCLRTDKFVCRNPRLTLYLTEDNVKAEHQSGAEESYFHQHLIRDYESTWGVPVDWNGNSYEFETTLKWTASSDINNMQVVGVLSNYNSEDPLDCEVHNSTTAYLVPKASGIADAYAEPAVSPFSRGIYTMTGMRLPDTAPLAPGLYIINGKKTLVR